MSIDGDGWIDWAEKVPGPTHKQYGARNRMNGLVLHSVEGNGRAGILRTLMDDLRQASWTFTNLKDGTMLQHYPIWASTWASGNYKANSTLIPTESEGLAGEPLNDAQIRNMMRLAAEFEALTGIAAVRNPADERTVWQHREVALWMVPNAGPTACPSNRYDPFFIALDGREEEDMQDPRVDALMQALTGLAGKSADERLAAWNATGNSLLDGFTIDQKRIDDLVAGRLPAGTKVTVEVTE